MTAQEREGSEFQVYKGFSVEYRDASHRYWIRHEWPDSSPDDRRVPAISVTSALSVLDKPALRRWQGNLDAEATLDAERNGELIGIPTEKAIYVVREKGMGAEAKRDSGAARGTAVHEVLRKYCQEGHVPLLSGYNDEVRGYVQAIASWLVEAAPEPELVEQIVGSPSHGYAGRFDLLCTIDGKRTLVDLKTSEKIWPEHHLQMAGYLLTLPECQIEEPESTIILACSESGHYTTAECRAEPQQFLDILAAHRALAQVKKAVKANEPK